MSQFVDAVGLSLAGFLVGAVGTNDPVEASLRIETPGRPVRWLVIDGEPSIAATILVRRVVLGDGQLRLVVAEISGVFVADKDALEAGRFGFDPALHVALAVRAALERMLDRGYVAEIAFEGMRNEPFLASLLRRGYAAVQSSTVAAFAASRSTLLAAR